MSNSLLGRPKFQIGSSRFVFESGLYWRVGYDWQPNFSKLAIILDYKGPWMLSLALPARCKVLKLDFQSEVSMSKIFLIFLIFILLRNKILGAHLLLKWFFCNFNFKTTSNGKIMPDFWRGGKARQINPGHLQLGRMANFVSPFEK